MIVRFEKLRKNTIAGKFYVDFKYFEDFKLKTLLITFEVPNSKILQKKFLLLQVVTPDSYTERPIRISVEMKLFRSQ